MNGNGIPMTINVEGDEQQATVYLATLRRCPKLGKLIKAIRQLSDVQLPALRKRLALLNAQLDAATDPQELDAIEAQLTEATAKEMDLQLSMPALCDDLTLQALLGSNLYSEADARRYAAQVPDGRLSEVIQAICTGASRLDFTQPLPMETPPQPS